MPDIYGDIQVCLGISAADLAGRNQLVIDINGTDYTQTIPDPASYYWNDRQGNSLPFQLQAALNAAEVTAGTGRTWALTWDTPVLGYYTLTRSGTTNDVTLEWTNANTTVEPLWFGFGSDQDDVAVGKTVFVSRYQAGRLWLPGRQASVWRPRRIVEAYSQLNPHTHAVTRYSAGGGRMWELMVQQVPGLFVWEYASTETAHRRARPGVVVGDPNVSWEGGIWRWLGETQSPLRVWMDQGVLATYEDGLQVWREEHLMDMSKVWRDAGLSPDAYDVQMFLAQGL